MTIAKNPKNQTQANRPATEFREGNIRVTIWPITGGDGTNRYSVIISRSYQTEGKWKSTSYLGRYDIQRTRKLLDRADDWIFQNHVGDEAYPADTEKPAGQY